MPRYAVDRKFVQTDEVVERLRRMLDDYRRRQHRPIGQASTTRERVVASGLVPLDRALRHGGLPAAAVTEILFAAPGLGAMSLALRVGNHASEGKRTVVVIDVSATPEGPSSTGRGFLKGRRTAAADFYPPAAQQVGLTPDRLLVIRPNRSADALWAAEQCLRCAAVGAVVARLDRVRPAESRRLQLAAENGGNLGLILKPLSVRQKTFAAVQLAMEPVAVKKRWAEKRRQDDLLDTTEIIPTLFCRPVRITVLKQREGMPAEPFIVGLDDEAGFVPLHSAPVDRSPRASRRRVGA